MKKLILLFLTVTLGFSLELKFSDTAMPEFKLYGMTANVTYKTKEERNTKIAQLWENFLSSKFLDLKQSEDKKLYVVYTNYKSNAFDCFIGIKSIKPLNRFDSKRVAASKYSTALIDYTNNLNIESIWDDINQQKIKRNFKTDIETYQIDDLAKKRYFIKIFLSKK